VEELSSAAVSPRIGYYQVLWFRYAFKHGCLSNMCTWSLWRISPQERMKPKHQEQMSKRAPDDEHLFLRRKMSERQSHE